MGQAATELRRAAQPQMNTDLQPIAEQPRLTRKVNAFAGVCIGVYLCLSVSICGFIVSTAVFRIMRLAEAVGFGGAGAELAHRFPSVSRGEDVLHPSNKNGRQKHLAAGWFDATTFLSRRLGLANLSLSLSAVWPGSFN